MKTKALLPLLGKVLHMIVYVIGARTKFKYAEGRWPETCRSILYGTGVVFLVRKYFLHPDRAARQDETA